jgi:SlyX protein
MSDERIAELEIKLSFQDELLDVLNQTVIRQQQDIDQLQAHVRLLLQQVRSMSSPVQQGTPEEEIPPHY